MSIVCFYSLIENFYVQTFAEYKTEEERILKFRDFMNTLRNFAKSVFARIFAKLKYLAKQFKLTESPDHVL